MCTEEGRSLGVTGGMSARGAERWLWGQGPGPASRPWASELTSSRLGFFIYTVQIMKSPIWQSCGEQ